MNSWKENMAMEKRRAALQREINESCYTPISFEIYKKTIEEKVALANAKCKYKDALRKHNAALES